MSSKFNDVCVAETILQQLGQSRFMAMTGAKDFLALSDPSGLQFKLPGNIAKDRINVVRIALLPGDLYDIEYGYARGLNYRVIRTSEGLYADQLRSDFTTNTGLDTSL